MKLEFQFKDGVTAPVELSLSHYDYDGDRKIQLMASSPSAYPEQNTTIPLPFSEARMIGTIFQDVFDLLSDVTSEEFLEHGRAGVIYKLPGGTR